MKNTRVKMTKPLYLGMSILDISKILMYEFPMMLRDGFIRLTMIKMPLPIGKNKEVPGLFKDELGGKVIIEAVARRPKTYAYLIDDGSEHKKSKGTKRCVIK